MGNFETIVRPVVFPNIRPVQSRSVAPENDPEQGLAHINGQGGQIVSLPYNFTQNISRTKQQEFKRRVDEVRIFQKEGEGDDATINRDNYLDVQVTDKLWMKQSGRGGDITGVGGPVQFEDIPMYFQKVVETSNIEIRERGKIIENPNFTGP
jgi:hypothetical protein